MSQYLFLHSNGSLRQAISQNANCFLYRKGPFQPIVLLGFLKFFLKVFFFHEFCRSLQSKTALNLNCVDCTLFAANKGSDLGRVKAKRNS